MNLYYYGNHFLIQDIPFIYYHVTEWVLQYSFRLLDGLFGRVDLIKKVKASYSLPSVAPEADPGVQAVSPQVTWSHPPGGRLPLLSARPAGYLSSRKASPHIGRPVPNYNAWWQRHMSMSSLPKAVTWKRTGRDLNPRPLVSRAYALPLSHTGHT